ncbi:2'-5' RNA ligase superfamily protein [Bosea sp. 62]|uniref:2'-5' RNA ligase family protein n=1 Tax=unclassified Bosea (in: a-proteobacteria) TaxID=2653178 RepID=UPI00125C8023|nr:MULTISPECIES: 2'-5' RNA ligase family protein [unclassified Bosea (in: a-proteobacteria)]CAD5265591.1 2'-5' RNA ligase superfamily protein [Bosea sp. 46]CAD5267578.1 2'-5' RNA ligase superfamily protein [Bosea sp. 21B]CAD5271430.1 2'-5' RNA ligase superfamily protein [Bosea sp. 7B]VVT55674.1 2'-5' RNA ligase [Bosea sp. EC-HK365B]VXB86982.1 2'-5' RNA ligase superfamily protein [Bosea sp. 29B]
MLGITLSASSLAQPFWDQVDEASALEDAPSIRALGYRPHLTLTRYSTVDLTVLRKGMETFDRQAAISLYFDRVDFFDSDPLMLWLAPRQDQRLLDLHHRLHATLGPKVPACDPHYAPAQWKPHLTVAMAIPASKRPDVLKLVSRSLDAFELTFDSVDCVSWPPVQVLHRLALAGGADGR